MRNPYAPPLAPVGDPIRPTPIDRPRQVVLATVLLWAGLALSTAYWAFEWRSLGTALPIYIAVPSAVVGFVFRAWLTSKIYAGRNWARLTLLVSALLGLLALLVPASRVVARSPTPVFVRIGLWALFLAAIVLLFTRAANEWFKRENGANRSGG
jgi:peptidoglycan/LPS O-acetylase OafA/YrhL